MSPHIFNRRHRRHRRHRRLLLLGVAACLGLGALAWLVSPRVGSEKIVSAITPPQRVGAASAPISISVSEERPLTVEGDSGGGKFPLVISLDEVCLKSPDGTETIVPLDPVATTATLAARLLSYAPAFEALPTAYPANEPRSEMNRRLVTRKLRVQLPEDAASRIAGANGLQISERPDYAPDWVIMSAPDPLGALAAIDGVRANPAVASADVLLAKWQFSRTLPNDALVTNQWNLKKTSTSTAGTDLNIENAWKYGFSDGVKGTNIYIGVIDNGVETAHPDFAGNIDTANGWDWNGNDSDPNPSGTYHHGTAVAGVAAARGNNGIGVTGTAPEARLVGLRLTGGSTTDATEAAAMAWKNDLIQVKNNSWGPPDSGVLLDAPGPLTLAALGNAVTTGRGGKGTIFIWAGGNGKAAGDNSNYDGYANSIYTIAVGAIDSKGRSADYSEPGANLLVCAPSKSSDSLGVTTVDRSGTAGYNTASGVAGNYTDTFGGTSAAAPAVSGVVALMLEKNPNLGWRDVQEILLRSAVKFLPTDSGWKINAAGFKFNDQFGGGLVDATAAVNLAADWVNLPAQTSLTVSDNGSSAIPENTTAGTTRTFVFASSTHRVEQATVTLSATHSSRGNLEITLTSPGGTVSKLAAVHSDSNSNYSSWTFSTVQNWGESATGSWTLRVADRSASGNTSGGTLGAVTLKLFGAPANPPPQVEITSPATGTSVSPAATPLLVKISASDLTASGTAGVVGSVRLLVDSVAVGTLTTAPYEFSISPSLGTHSLVAEAIDSQGLKTLSAPISITVANQPPVISAVAFFSGTTLLDRDAAIPAQAFADEALTIASIEAIDPEGGNLTYSYQWQSSTNGTSFADVSGQTAAILAASPLNAGKLWRCLVTASDGTNLSAPFVSEMVNLLTRPPTVAKRGGGYSYASDLVLGGPAPLFRFGAGVDVPAGLSLDPATGHLSGTVAPGAAVGEHLIIIERYNSLGEVIFQNYLLKVAAANYTDWIGLFGVANPAAAADPDGDGVQNLVEYLLDSNPQVADAAVAFTSEPDSISLSFHQSKLATDATLEVEWSTNLAAASWQTQGIGMTVLGDSDVSTWRRASLAIDPAEPKKFLRLRATSTP